MSDTCYLCIASDSCPYCGMSDGSYDIEDCERVLADAVERKRSEYRDAFWDYVEDYE